MTDQDHSPALESPVEQSAVDHLKETQPMTTQRQQPIPPPSEPMQFRAIGLVQGKYHPSDERFNRGQLEVEDGILVDAVLLGQVMSLVKKYVDLAQSYFWVVYPRTREKEQTLHLQVVGVWSADGFGPITDEESTLHLESTPTETETEADSVSAIEDGYFSVRGQIVYQSNEKQLLYVKIQQAPRKSKGREDKGKSFKLKVNGVLPQKAIGYFWDLHVQRQGNELVLQDGASVALMPIQKNQRPQKRPSKPFSKTPPVKPSRPYKPQTNSTDDKRVIPKPIKRQSQTTD
jgi:hypothetical protein